MDESMLMSPRRVTDSGVVSERPCLVYSICGIGIADATNVYGIHNGHNTSDDLQFRLVAVAYSADFRLFAQPWFFSKGIYIDFTTNGSEVSIQYMEVGRR